MSDHATHILVSFCNTATGAPPVVLYEIATGTITVPRMPPEVAIRKPSGLAEAGGFLYVMTSRTDGSLAASVSHPNPSTLFVFDRHTLALVATNVCELVFDGHSMLVRERGLDVVSTGTDEIVHLTMQGPHVVSEQAVWRADAHGKRADVHHLNAIGLWRGETYVSGFGRKEGSSWRSTPHGFVEAVDTGERILRDIRQPHSILDVDGALVYCQSGTSTVHVHGTGAERRLPGYARGLCRVQNAIFAGTSRGRQVSKSTGLLTTRSDPGAAAGRCTLVRLTPATLEIEAVVELDPYGIEIYDLLPVAEVAAWPLMDEREWRDRYISGLFAGFEERDASMAWLHTEVGERDAAIEWLHWEVAERDRALVWLHQEVADRVREIDDLKARLAAQPEGA
jgi:hypothetical protein